MSHGTIFTLLVTLSCAVDFIAGAVVLRQVTMSSRTGQLDIGRVGWAILLMGFIFLVKLPPLWMFGLDGFGIMRLIWIDLVVVSPALAILVLLGGKLRNPGKRGRRTIVAPTRLVGLAAALTITLAPVLAVWCMVIEPRRLIVEEHDVVVPRIRTGNQAIRVGVLADIQSDDIGAFEHGAIEELLAGRPDVILIPGDLVQTWIDDLPEQTRRMRELLARLKAPGGVFFTLGDCESRDQANTLLEGLDIEILENREVEIRVRDRYVRIGGLGIDVAEFDAIGVIQELESPPEDGSLRILVSHRPDALERMAVNSRIDLVIAGHTHGGQVQVPLFGPPITLTDVPRRVAAGGLHIIDGRRIYVSRGLGMERRQAPRIRFRCPPEVTLLTICEDDAGGLATLTN
ncbi:MAG: metallophosphoesterase [Planctomycetota bacterium]|jgi:predicted MPP superfamily phosphohydrolase